MEKTTKSITEFYSIDTTKNRMNGLIYYDENKKTHYQNTDIILNIPKNSDGSYYLSITEEVQYRPGKIAKLVYGDELLYWVILQHNNIIDPFTLTIGREIEIPDIRLVREAIMNKKDEFIQKAK